MPEDETVRKMMAEAQDFRDAQKYKIPDIVFTKVVDVVTEITINGIPFGHCIDEYKIEQCAGKQAKVTLPSSSI